MFTCQSPEALPLGMLLTIMGVGAMAGALSLRQCRMMRVVAGI